MIEFNKVSNESYFIKNLLYSTFLPLIRTVRENDFIMKDRLYIYKCNIIKCTNSGYIAVKNVNMNIDEYPKSMVRKSDDEKVKQDQVYYYYLNGSLREIVGKAGDHRSPRKEGWLEKNIASYRILGEYYFGERNDKFCRNFLSSSEGYDYKTHEHLGHYLRSLRDMYSLNLMPLYNCFSNQLLRNIHISNDKIEKTSKDFSTKVYKIPIRFNTDYTVCIDNIGMTTLAPAFIRHGTLMKLNNTRYGNGIDVTNKYIRLNQGDVIHNKPNLRFKNPIKIRFDNIPQKKVIHYTNPVFTEIPSKYNANYYRLNSNAYPAFRKSFKEVTYDENGKAIDGTWRTIDYVDPYSDGIKNYQAGYEFILDEGDGDSLKPADDLLTNIDPNTGEEPLILPLPSYEMYESLDPSVGTFEELQKSYKKCPEDETLFNRNIFNSNKTKYYTFDDVTSLYVQCNVNTVYDPDTIYYYIDKEKDEGWYEFIEGEFVKTEDTYIDPEKTYYKKEMTEIPVTANYDITEENCCMYDYIEDNLFLLIQVPLAYNKNIVVLEGDYTDRSKEYYYDDNKFELFSRDKLDHLFTDHLILMETLTTKIKPFSETLIQYLLWHAINGLDTINNDMDRLSDDLSTVATLTYNSIGNYWTDRYREAVFKYANTFPKKYIRDNLGYVTTDVERIIKVGDDYYDSEILSENLEMIETYQEDEEG